MFSRLTSKLSGMIIGAVAVLAIVGTGAAMAAQNHIGPFTGSSSAAGASATQSGTFEARGVIQHIAFDQATTQSGSLALLTSANQTVTVFFTAQTEVEADHSGDNEGQGDDDAGQITLQVGQSVRVEGTPQADGSVLAREIKVDVAAAGVPTGVPPIEPGEDEKLTGVIQSIDTTGQTFMLALDNGGGVVTIAYDANTNIEHEHSNSTFAAGSRVLVEVLARADGSLYAKEIKPASDDGHGDGDNSGPGGGDDGSGDGSGNSGPGGGGSGGGDDGPGH